MRYFAAWLYFLGTVSAVAGVIIFLTNIPNVPDEDDLVLYSGFVVGIRLEKDFDGTDVVYFLIRDDEVRYKYMSSYPMYVEVRDRLGIYRDVDLMIEKGAEPDFDGAVRIWGLVEHDPYNPGTVVTFAEIVEETTETDRSWQGVSFYILGGGLLLLLMAFGIRRAVPHVAKDPSA
jgi:hypothetical protein